MGAAKEPNLFENLPPGSRETMEVLFQSGSVRIERIVSHGEASPAGFWYDQESDEWVALLRGTATLEYLGGEQKSLRAGDYLLIPAHLKHRVSEVSQDALWLALHFQK